MTNDRRPFSIMRPLLYASLLGLVGFVCGYFGPIYLNPSANQGPLLGIFITGPLGVIVGLILGSIVQPRRPQTAIAIPLIAGLILSSFTLYRSLPEDRYQGFIIDAEIIGCESPTSFVPAAIARWDNIKSTPDYIIRPEWKQGVARMIEADKGVVVSMKIHRKKKIYKQRKPWNRDHIVATLWEPVGVTEKYFARNSVGSCSDIKMGQRASYSPIWDESRVSPPDVLPTFLGFHTLQPVSSKFQQFTK